MITDRQGNRVSGATPETIALFDQALAEFNLYRGDPVATIDRALAAAPGFVMAHVLKAYILALATEPQATAQASQILAGARACATNEREQSHLVILDKLVRGNWTAAAMAMHLHNVQHPHDLLGLTVGRFRTRARRAVCACQFGNLLVVITAIGRSSGCPSPPRGPLCSTSRTVTRGRDSFAGDRMRIPRHGCIESK